MDPQIRLPAEMLQAMTSGQTVGTEPAQAASVVLIRDAPTGPEVYLQIRAASMQFAAGRPVFPGGRVDSDDEEPVSDWTGPTPEAWANRLGISAVQARALINAAVRETFEESGYLMASAADGTTLTDLVSDEWRVSREALSRHDISLATLFARHGLRLRSDWLKFWSVWVTPEFEPRRFHTWFFTARCPVEQRVLGVSRESTTDRWISVEQALREADAGTLPLLPPQYCTFLELYGHHELTSIESVERAGSVVRPTMASDNHGHYLSLPADLVDLGIKIESLMYESKGQGNV